MMSHVEKWAVPDPPEPTEEDVASLTMNVFEAILAATSGKLVRRPGWAEGRFIGPTEIASGLPIFATDDVMEDDWEVMP